MRKLLIIIFTTILLGFLNSNVVYAKTWVVGNFQMEADDPIFSDAIVWAPGMSQTKSVIIRNLGSDTKKVLVKASNTSQTGDIHKKIAFKITQSGTNLYGAPNSKTLENFWNDGEIALTDINGNSWTTYDFNALFPADMGNEYQGKSAKFDMQIGFEGSGEGTTITAIAGASTTNPAFTSTTYYPGVLGEESATDSATLSGEISEEVILGENTESSCPNCLWWPFILCQLLLSLVTIYLGLRRNIGVKSATTLLTMIGVLTVGLFFIVNRTCDFNFVGISWGCRYLWLISVGIVFLTTSILKLLQARK